jgi:hypothetical protein
MRFLLRGRASGLFFSCVVLGGCGGKVLDGKGRGADASGGGPGDEASLAPCVGPGAYDRCAGVCVDLATDPSNCGGCGDVCPCGGTCSGGRCFGGLGVRCGAQCADTSADPSNCGSCGAACASGQICLNGTCEDRVTCTGGTIDCDNTCVDAYTDRFNCGTCHKRCPMQRSPQSMAGSPTQCEAGACGCTPGTTDCGGDYCVDLQHDGQNCGACGFVCVGSVVCSMGQCQASCDAGLSVCGSSCVDPMSDPFQCGPHCTSCQHGSQICDGGACVTCPDASCR